MTDLGDRRSINMEVTRKALSTPILIGVALLVLARDAQQNCVGVQQLFGQG